MWLIYVWIVKWWIKKHATATTSKWIQITAPYISQGIESSVNERWILFFDTSQKLPQCMRTSNEITVAALVIHLALYLVKCLVLVFWDVAVQALLFVFLMFFYYHQTIWPAREVLVSNGPTRLWRLELMLINCLATPSPYLWYEVLYLSLEVVHRSVKQITNLHSFLCISCNFETAYQQIKDDCIICNGCK